MLKIIGICMLLFTLICLVPWIANGMRQRTEIHSELLDFLKHVRRQVGCYLLPLSEIAESYSTPHLEECGFLASVRKGTDPIPSLSIRHRVSDSVKRILETTFSSFGTGYVEDEVRLLDEAIGEMSSLLKDDVAESEKRIKLYSVLICAGGVGFLILVL